MAQPSHFESQEIGIRRFQKGWECARLVNDDA